MGARGLVARWAGVEAAGGPGEVSPKSGAYGIAQWLGARKAGVPRDFEGQLQYALKELHGSEGRAFASLQAAKTPEEAAAAASQYERAEGYSSATGRDIWVGKTLRAMGQLWPTNTTARADGSAPGAPPSGSDVGAGGSADLSPVAAHMPGRRMGIPGEFNAAASGQFGPPGPTMQTQITLKDGQRLTVNKMVADRYKGFFDSMIDRGYPVNTGGGGGGYNLRSKVGGGGLSMHAYGTAADINVGQNPYMGRTNMRDDDVERLAWQHGLSWGGRFGDPMHFEAMGPQAWAVRREQLAARQAPRGRLVRRHRSRRHRSVNDAKG